MGKTSLAPGFRFHPTDVELVKFYLKRKVWQKKLPSDVISELDIYKYAPWDLPDKSCLKSGDLNWYFFCPREKKYSSGGRMNRATEFGHWKITGKNRLVHHHNEIVGSLKTLIFHRGRAPTGERTDWVMHEYRLEDSDLADKGVSQNSYVLCKIFQKAGLGPKNGAHYGAPFEEDEWDDEEEEEKLNSIEEVIPSVGFFSPALMLPCNDPSSSTVPKPCITNQDIRTASESCVPKPCITNQYIRTASESCMSATVPSLSNPNLQAPGGAFATTETPQHDDDILSLLDLDLDLATEGNTSVLNGRGVSEGNHIGSSGSRKPELLPSPSEMSSQVLVTDATAMEIPTDDELLSILASFTEDDSGVDFQLK